MLAPPGFRDLELIGTGATSRVYRAIETKTGRSVALKRLHRQLASDPEAIAKLRRELESLGRLKHPAIVPVRDVIRWQGDPTIVMDFIAGVDLKEAIRARRVLADQELEKIARALFDVLAATHGAGIVHRDVKPQNVRLAEDGRIYLLDFGSARLDGSSQLTANGTTVGTPEYMAPELFAGAVYDPRVDLYGAGATLFECAAGRAPQLAESLTELAFKRTKEDVPSVATFNRTLSPAIVQVIDRCLARAPEDRYPSASLAAWALDHPELERQFRARRLRSPPCLHCGAAIARESVVCAACGSDHPFAYAPGSAHVVARGAREPDRFVSALIARFPERGEERSLRALSERLAALGQERQRVVSFIDRGEAESLAGELAAAGVECEVVEDEGTSRWRFRTFALFALLASAWFVLSIVLGLEVPLLALPLFLAPAALTYALVRAGAAIEAEHGLLSAGASPPVVPGARSTLAITAAMSFSVGLAAPLIGTALDLIGFHPLLSEIVVALRPAFWVGALAAGAAAVVAHGTRLANAPRTAAGSPEPSWGSKLRRAFSSPSALTKRVGGGVAALLTAVVLGLVPMELYGLSTLRSLDNTTTWFALMEGTEDLRTVTSELFAPLETIAEPEPAIEAPPPTTDRPRSRLRSRSGRLSDLEASRLGARPVADALEPDEAAPLFEPAAPVEKPFVWTPGKIVAAGTSAVFALAGLFLSLYFVLRKRGLRREAEQIFAALDRRALASSKDAPVSRLVDRHPSDADQLALALSTAGSFVSAARKRAVELAHHLPAEETARLRRALTAISDPKHDAIERALLARCISELDPQQKQRFELLELEGQLEAIAASAFAAKGGAR